MHAKTNNNSENNYCLLRFESILKWTKEIIRTYCLALVKTYQRIEQFAFKNIYHTVFSCKEKTDSNRRLCSFRFPFVFIGTTRYLTNCKLLPRENIYSLFFFYGCLFLNMSQNIFQSQNINSCLRYFYLFRCQKIFFSTRSTRRETLTT